MGIWKKNNVENKITKFSNIIILGDTKIILSKNIKQKIKLYPSFNINQPTISFWASNLCEKKINNKLIKLLEPFYIKNPNTIK